ncbi:MAG: hypothetical protein ABI655_11115, partial [Phenylobacterium sp.]
VSATRGPVMTEMKLLQPHPGSWILPLMQFAGVEESPRPDVVLLVFQARHEAAEETMELSMSLPVTTVDAAALLAALQSVQGSELPGAAWAPKAVQ